MSDTYQQAQAAMAEHAKQMHQAARGNPSAVYAAADHAVRGLHYDEAPPHDASCRCGACFHAAQDQRMAEANNAVLAPGMTQERAQAQMAEATAATSTWRQCAEARAAQLDAAQATIADAARDLRIARVVREEMRQTIAALRAMLAAQQAVIDAAQATRDARTPPPTDMYEDCMVTDAPAFPSRALRGGDGVPR
jgi:multidrug efflux pump subunit AcrA (membrane-fusion protein)